jgi:hypothetical protein
MKEQRTEIRQPGSEMPAGPIRFAGPAIILLAAAVATAPILLHGSYCGDDFEFHVVSWFDVQQSWLHGIPYPHWMGSANYGAGEPRFMFYPPLAWMLGAALGLALPWTLVPVALVFLVLAATGLATRALASEVLADAPATLAGCTTLFSGFALFTAYERTAFAELMGGFWIPLLLLFALRDRRADAPLWQRALDGSTLPLALVVAGCWLSDGPVGVMASYLLAAVAMMASVLTRSWALLLRASIASALGIGLAGLYLIPAAREQGWVDLDAAVNLPVFQIENNFLFMRFTDAKLARFTAFLDRASWLAVGMIGVALASAAVLWLRSRRPALKTDHSQDPGLGRILRQWWIPIGLIPGVVLVLLLPVSLPVWHGLPKLRFLQYPWRWMLVLEAPTALLFSRALWPPGARRPGLRGFVIAACSIAFLASTFLAAKNFLRVCQEGDTVADLLESYRGGGGLEGTDEYEPPEADHWKIATGLPDGCFVRDSDTTLGVAEADGAIAAWKPEQGSCEATATAELHTPEHVRLEMTSPHAGFVILKLVSFPAWRIQVNGKPAEEADPRDDGLIAVAVPQGPVRLTADWTTTPDVNLGRVASGAALLVLIGVGWQERRHFKHRE